MAQFDFKSAEGYQGYIKLLEQLYVERKLCAIRLEEDAVYNSSTEMTPAARTIAQLSYLMNQRKIRIAALPHPSIQYLFQILFLIQKICLEDDIPESIYSSLLTLRINLWDSIQGSEYRYDLVIVVIRRLVKTLGKTEFSSELFVQLTNVIKSLMDSLSLTKFHYTSLLWRKNCTVSLVDESLWMVGKQLDSVDKEMDFWSLDPKGIFFINKDWFQLTNDWNKWTERKRMTIDAMSTLFFLNDEDQMNEELFLLMKSVPEKLSSKPMDIDLVEQGSLQTVEDAQNMVTRFLMWPIQDTLCIFTEMSLIKEMFGILLSDESIHGTSLSEKLKSYLSTAVNSSSFPPLHFEPLQRLTWFCDSENNQLKISGKKYLI
jgi:hypothetical protein